MRALDVRVDERFEVTVARGRLSARSHSAKRGSACGKRTEDRIDDQPAEASESRRVTRPGGQFHPGSTGIICFDGSHHLRHRGRLHGHRQPERELRIRGNPAYGRESSTDRVRQSAVPGPVVTATLRLFATTDNAKGVDAFQVPSTEWSENSLTDTNKPAVGAQAGTSGAIFVNRWVDIDVTGSITTAGDYSFALNAKDSHHVSYRSREAAANSPRLVLELAGDPAPTSTSNSATQPDSTTSSAHPVEPATVRAAFYYPWFTETWGRSTDPFSVYHPGLGYYSSDDSAVVARHLATMQYANLNAAIVSWWGQGRHNEQARIPALLNAASGTQFTEALYYEKEGFADPGVTELSADLKYIQQRYASHANYLTRGGVRCSWRSATRLTAARWPVDGSRPTQGASSSS